MDEQAEEEDRMILVHRRVTKASQQASRANGAQAKAIVTSEAHRAKLKEAQQARRKRERLAKLAQPPAPVAEKRPAGRPRTRPIPDADAPKRKPGRPRKESVDG